MNTYRAISNSVLFMRGDEQINGYVVLVITGTC